MTTAAPSNFVSIVYLPSHEVHFLAEFADDVVDEGIRERSSSTRTLTRTLRKPTRMAHLPGHESNIIDWEGGFFLKSPQRTTHWIWRPTWPAMKVI